MCSWRLFADNVLSGTTRGIDRIEEDLFARETEAKSGHLPHEVLPRVTPVPIPIEGLLPVVSPLFHISNVEAHEVASSFEERDARKTHRTAHSTVGVTKRFYKFFAFVRRGSEELDLGVAAEKWQMYINKSKK